MKKVRLIKPYLDMEVGKILKLDGETARNLIERGIAVDPEAPVMATKEPEKDARSFYQGRKTETKKK